MFRLSAAPILLMFLASEKIMKYFITTLVLIAPLLSACSEPTPDYKKMPMTDLQSFVEKEMIAECGVLTDPTFRECSLALKDTEASVVLKKRQAKERVKHMGDVSFKRSTNPIDVFSK